MGSWRDKPMPVPPEQVRETAECDLVVVGLGYAGTAALRWCRLRRSAARWATVNSSQ